MSESTTPMPISGEAATTRLARLLTMVPWLMGRQGIDIEQAARTLGVSRKQIEADLALLFVCGTPGHMPDDLIEAEWEEGYVYVRNADTIAKPLRFTRDEALALTVGLRTLLDVPGLTERDAVDRALAKLVEATGESGDPSNRVRVSLERDGDEVLRLLREALDASRRVHLRYVVPSRDEMTERDVDPMRLLNTEGHWYLEGWCHRAQDVRMFRLDRVESVKVLDAAATVPTDAATTDLSRGFFAPNDSDPSARIRLAPEAAWVADYYPCHDVERSGEYLDVTLYVGDGRWLRRLLLQLGGAARVLRPASLTDDVADEARRALEAYGVDPSQTARAL